ncbi:hypothetical protein [Sinorhizobium terangae]|uniref:hypothetical protein n=1 Tax=Sinorhizobium terangae TaxID=110322 RepID=UPI0024B1A677|nr:hypothetical protein [Sinorhizobium terangae]WFU49799.1 hypothetical protein QA637_04270 [Sinorhizobium terangae]
MEMTRSAPALKSGRVKAIFTTVGRASILPAFCPVLRAFNPPKCEMDKAGLTFSALILVLIALIMSILAVDRRVVDVAPDRPALVITNQAHP